MCFGFCLFAFRICVALLKKKVFLKDMICLMRGTPSKLREYANMS